MSEIAQTRRYERRPAPNVGLVETLVILEHGALKKVGNSLLYDRSRFGLSVVLDVPLSLGTKVVLRNRYVNCAGTVRHCQRLDLVYKVGLLLYKQ